MKDVRRLKAGLTLSLVMLLLTTTLSCGRQAPIYTQGAQIRATALPDEFVVNKAWLERQSTDTKTLLSALRQCRAGVK